MNTTEERNEIKFGNEAWFEALNKQVTFPAYIAFYLTSDKSFHTMVVKSKASSIGNLKYESVSPPWHLNSKEVALCGVRKIESDKEYYNELLRLNESWGGSLNEQSS